MAGTRSATVDPAVDLRTIVDHMKESELVNESSSKLTGTVFAVVLTDPGTGSASAAFGGEQ